MKVKLPDWLRRSRDWLCRIAGRRGAGGASEAEEVFFFRGTSEGFAGSAGLHEIGITPTSTDALVATLFATESSQCGTGVVHIVSSADLAGLEIVEGNVLSSLEREVGVAVQPLEFANRARTTITAEEARAILRGMGIQLPGQIHSKVVLAEILRDSPRLTREQIIEFVRQAEAVRK